MRIAIVFSSPTSGTNEFKNVWKKCPESRETDPGKLVIEGGNWKVFAFDGLSRNYHYGAWNIETLQHEIAAITKEHAPSALGVLLHGTKKELSLLVQQVHVPDVYELYAKSYASTVGTFFKKCIKPFSQDCSDRLFEELWTKIKKTEEKNVEDGVPDPKGQLIFISHRLTGMIRSMCMIMEDAEEDNSLLKDFKRFDFDFLLKEYEAVERQVKELDIPRIKEAPKMITNIQGIISEMSGRESYSRQDLKLGYGCLEKAEALQDILRQASEVIHD